MKQKTAYWAYSWYDSCLPFQTKLRDLDEVASFQLAYIAHCPCLENFARETTAASKPDRKNRQKTGWKAMGGFSLSWTIIVLCWMVMKTWGGEWLKEVLFTWSTTNHDVHKVLSHWVHKSSFWKERYCFFHSVCFINIKCERVSPPSGKSMGKVRPSSSPPLYSFSRKGIKRHVSQVEWWYMMWDRKFETEDARSLTSLVLWQNVPNNMFLEKF